MKLSLIVATVERTEQLGRLLESLSKQTEKNFETIIVDQNPDSRLVPYIQKGRNSGLIIRHEKLAEAKLSLARNIGLSHATADLIGFPDDDCWYEPDVVARVNETFQSSSELDVIVTNWAENGRNGQVPFNFDYEQFSRFRGGVASGGMALSFHTFYRHAVLSELDGFDVRLGLGNYYGSGEETDLMLRLLKRGFRARFIPDISVHHPFNSIHPVELGAVRSRQRGTGALYAKHRMPTYIIVRGLIAPVLLSPLGIRGLPALRRGLAMIQGRWKGYWRWRQQFSVDRDDRRAQ